MTEQATASPRAIQREWPLLAPIPEVMGSRHQKDHRDLVLLLCFMVGGVGPVRRDLPWERGDDLPTSWAGMRPEPGFPDSW